MDEFRGRGALIDRQGEALSTRLWNVPIVRILIMSGCEPAKVCNNL